MWGSLALSMAFFVIILYLPGFFFLKTLRLPGITAVCCAPLVSVAFYSVFSIVLYKLDIFATWELMLLPFSALCVCAYVVSELVRRRSGASVLPDADSIGRSGRLDLNWIGLAAYVVVGIGAISLMFLRVLPDATAFYQAIDNVHHLGSAYTAFLSGNYSSFGSTLYVGEDALIDPFVDDVAGFYPSAWHCMVAMCLSALDVPVALAANALNATVAGVVFPASIFVLIRHVFADKPRVVLGGAATCMACSAFPWGFLIFGPLYPNMLAYALAPLVIFAFCKVFQVGAKRSARVVYALVVVAGLLCALFSQPNMAFFVAAALVPFCAIELYRVVSGHIAGEPKRSILGALAAAAFVCFACVVWHVLYRAPFLQDLVSFDWPSSTSPLQAFVNWLSLSMTWWSVFHAILAVLVVIGFVYCITHKKYRWVAVSYLVLAFIYAAGVAGPYGLKHLLSGFWYTDSFRLAAMVGIWTVPLSAVGASAVCALLAKALASCVKSEGCRWAASAAVLAIALLFPSFWLNGVGEVNTPIGHMANLARLQNDGSAAPAALEGVPVDGDVLDGNELAFARKAIDLVGEDTPLVTNPNDGSAFLYAADGANLYYRYLSGYDSSTEKPESKEIRLHLADVATDPEVREAVEKTGVRYVLLFDVEEEQTDNDCYFNAYNPDQWVGVNSIDDQTPGFGVVMSEGDMRLYKIVA